MNNARSLALGRLLVREFSKTAPRSTEQVSPKFHKLKQIQQKFGVEDNVPVYLKGGAGDKILYAATLAITAVGLGMSLETWYRLAVK
ncbi:cytochrome c oxidase subunit 7A1, mitochondrial-like isoform X2 [Tribolium madens]|uniref:cytochrome c oxidase subunit 7A1, mitochondrial-like isoform X2 n=1 Tax=Tribolium madens TaxID=41895 RepID=UPI001CF73F14|nr:cytochrome c oxidase subunit 7A1, mitochondrial-like isoform X2 [Tribolium madens]